jgi:hypothetical protein
MKSYYGVSPWRRDRADRLDLDIALGDDGRLRFRRLIPTPARARELLDAPHRLGHMLMV